MDNISIFYWAKKSYVVRPDTGRSVEAVEFDTPWDGSRAWLDRCNVNPNDTYVLEFDYWADSDGHIMRVFAGPDVWNDAFVYTGDYMNCGKMVQHARVEITPGISQISVSIGMYSGIGYISNVLFYPKSALGSANFDGNPFRYCAASGYYWDGDTGADTYYCRARYFDPVVGRFTTMDSFSGFSNDALSLNFYTYCANNPVNRCDPTGHFWWLIPIIVGIPLLLSSCDDNGLYFTFDPNPGYTTKKWNTSKYQSYTNCYAYAFNMLVNPLTGNRFPEGGMQPGMLSGQINYMPNDDYDSFNLSINDYAKYELMVTGTTAGNQLLINLITADARAVGLDFLPYNANLTGGYRVALAVSPNLGDYHWYRDNGDGTWSHKPGKSPVTNREFLGNNTYGDVITDPKDAAAKAGYSTFLGYYYIMPYVEIKSIGAITNADIRDENARRAATLPKYEWTSWGWITK